MRTADHPDLDPAKLIGDAANIAFVRVKPGLRAPAGAGWRLWLGGVACQGAFAALLVPAGLNARSVVRKPVRCARPP